MESLYRLTWYRMPARWACLQLVPDTARHTAAKWGKPAPTPQSLFDPVVNVPLGAAELRGMLDRYGGPRGACACRIQRGARQCGSLAHIGAGADARLDDVWIENIPFNETRGYVQRGLWHQLVFHLAAHRRAAERGGLAAAAKRSRQQRGHRASRGARCRHQTETSCNETLSCGRRSARRAAWPAGG